jgi:hypothetical protein
MVMTNEGRIGDNCRQFLIGFLETVWQPEDCRHDLK